MTVLLVCDIYGIENNGVVVAAKNLLRALRARGHRVKVLCADQGSKGELDTYVCPNRNFGFLLNDYVKKNGVSLGKVDKKVVAEAFQDVDIVHIIQPFTLGIYAAKYANQHGICVVGAFHTKAENVSAQFGMIKSKPINVQIYKIFWRKLYRRCQAIHYPALSAQQLFESIIKKKTNGYVISNGVQPAFEHVERKPKPAKYKGKYVILFSGRYSREKNQQVLIRAVLQSRHKEKIQLIFPGQGPLQEYLEKLAKPLPNPPLFTYIAHDKLVNYLGFTDLYVHAALIDLESISCLEGVAATLPLLTDSPQAAVYYFSRDPHCLFKSNDVTDLKDKIEWFIEHPKESAEIRAKYKDFGKEYSIKACMDKMEAMLVKTLKEYKKKKA